MIEKIILILTFRRKIITHNEFAKHRDMSLNCEFKGCIFHPLTEVIWLNQQRFLHKQKPLKVCKEYLYNNDVVLYFHKDFYLVKTMDEKISHFKSAGLIDHWISKYIDKKFLSLPEPAFKPKVMKIYPDFFGVFEIIFAGWILSLAGFLLELLAYSCCRHLRKVIYFVNFLGALHIHLSRKKPTVSSRMV